MKNLILASAFALVGVAGLTAPSAQAANARHPYSNVDHRNDKGNNTGDDQVERLNSMQLDQARAGAGAAPMMGGQGGMPMGASGTMPTMGGQGGMPMGASGTMPMMSGQGSMPMNGTTPMTGAPGSMPMGATATVPMNGAMPMPVRPGATPTR